MAVASKNECWDDRVAGEWDGEAAGQAGGRDGGDYGAFEGLAEMQAVHEGCRSDDEGDQSLRVLERGRDEGGQASHDLSAFRSLATSRALARPTSLPTASSSGVGRFLVRIILPLLLQRLSSHVMGKHHRRP